MASIFPFEAVCARMTAPDWRAAVRAGGQLLVAQGAATPQYVDGMIRTVEEFGPYVVLAPGMALPHSRPEDGALKTGFSLITLATPVAFGVPENDPVDIVISFAAVDKNAHVEALRVLASMLTDEPRLAAIRDAVTDAELFASVAVSDS